MKVENLSIYPLQLDDDRIIGAAGTPQATRKYSLDKLGSQDAQRVRAGVLQIIEEPVPVPPKTDNETTTKENKK